MYMNPYAQRKDLINQPTSVPFFNQDAVCIQDDQFLPDFSQDSSLQCCEQSQPRLQSPFQYHPDFQFVSPPSSAPSSPTSSPSSPFSHLPSTSAPAGDYSSSGFEAPSMTPASSYNPSINLQQPASPHSYYPSYQQQQQFFFDHPSMLTQQPIANTHAWEGNAQLLSPARIQNLSRTPQFHQSAKPVPSSPSSRSAPAGSANQRANGAAVSKPLPTPVQTPVQNGFLAPQFPNYDPSHDGNSADAEFAMRQAVIEQQQQQHQQQQRQSHHQHKSSDHSLPPSASSVSQNSPVTPQTNFEDLDDGSKAIATDYAHQNANNMSIGIPKLSRTISDIYQDELFNPNMMTTPQAPKQPANQQQNLLTPYRNVFADRLQAANQGHLARSQSPSAGNRSPFRQNSPFSAEYENPGVQQPPVATSIPVAQNGVNVQGTGDLKTMSPKDAMLDLQEPDDAGMPLFPSNQGDFNIGDTLGLRRESSGSFQQPTNFTTMDSFPTQYATHAATPQYPFMHQQDRQPPQQQNSLLHQTPEFPASLPHFESTNSEVLPSTEISPQAQPKMAMHPVKEEITRPSNTSAEGGTYTCTYHGCSIRFESPAKLQKHKREAHRQTTPGGHLIGREISSRNSQAGPHRCERINPSTGKPCNSIFSRPYDLTRHEDTIHNARKQKVRCHLCTEEKTFSRNDALTRHMRVVHPEVDWPGKQRRRGRD